MISIKKSILTLSVILLLSTMALSQGASKQHEPLIMLTQQRHEPIFNIDDIAKYAQKMTDLKAITINGQSLDTILQELKDLIDSLDIDPDQISSILDDKTDVEAMSKIKFDDIQNMDELKKVLEAHKNVLVHIDEPKRRTLSEEGSEDSLISAGPSGQLSFTESKLFVNMTPAALSGLLVTLFLLVVLVIAINCLYNVKTNDSYARNNLWVGKQS